MIAFHLEQLNSPIKKNKANKPKKQKTHFDPYFAIYKKLTQNDHRLKYKIPNDKTSRRKWENSCDLGLGKYF